MYAVFYLFMLFVVPALILGGWAWLMDAKAYSWRLTERGFAFLFVGLCVAFMAWTGVLLFALPLPFPGA